jgi:hypothetical protein
MDSPVLPERDLSHGRWKFQAQFDPGTPASITIATPPQKDALSQARAGLKPATQLLKEIESQSPVSQTRQIPPHRCKQSLG